MLKRTYDTHYKSNRKIHNLDVSIISSSRPELLKRMIESFQRCIFTHSKLRFLFHEDVLNYDKSMDCLGYVVELDIDAEVIDYVHSVPIGPGATMTFMRDKWQSEYIFHVQDDWEFELPIDVDRILWTMENHQDIKCIFFNKRSNEPIGDFDPSEVDKSGLKLCTSYFWPMLPGIWRVRSFRELWRKDFQKPEAELNKRLAQNSNLEQKIKLANLDKLGVYSLGHKNHPRYVRHLGEHYSTLPWKSRPDKTNNYKYSISDVRNRAPWLPEVGELP